MNIVVRWLMIKMAAKIGRHFSGNNSSLSEGATMMGLTGVNWAPSAWLTLSRLRSAWMGWCWNPCWC